MFQLLKQVSLLALLNSPYLLLLLINFCALCLFNFCHIPIVSSCQLQWYVNRLYRVPQNEATEMVLVSSAAALNFLILWGGACLLQQRPLLGPSSFLRMIHKWIWRVGGKIMWPNASRSSGDPSWMALEANPVLRFEKPLTPRVHVTNRPTVLFAFSLLSNGAVRVILCISESVFEPALSKLWY
jgi:hypothetical protein